MLYYVVNLVQSSKWSTVVGNNVVHLLVECGNCEFDSSCEDQNSYSDSRSRELIEHRDEIYLWLG